MNKFIVTTNNKGYKVECETDDNIRNYVLRCGMVHYIIDGMHVYIKSLAYPDVYKTIDTVYVYIDGKTNNSNNSYMFTLNRENIESSIPYARKALKRLSEEVKEDNINTFLIEF